jgi:hypothetical protein
MSDPAEAVIMHALDLLIQPGSTTTRQLADQILDELEAAGFIILPRSAVQAEAWRRDD